MKAVGGSAVRLVVSIVAIIIFLLGVIAFMSPVPIGIILMSIGLSTLVCVSPLAQTLLRNARTKHDSINQKMHTIERVVEKRIRFLNKAFIKTRPSNNEAP